MFAATMHEGEIVRTPRGFLAVVNGPGEGGRARLTYIEGVVIGQQVDLFPRLLVHVSSKLASDLPMRGE